MPKYITNWNLGINRKNYAPGAIINLSQAEAAALGAVVSPAAEVEQEEPGTSSAKDEGGQQPSRTFQFRATKDFKFKKQEYKKNQVLNIDLAVAQEIGSERIEMVDPEVYRKYMEEQQAAELERQKQAGAGRPKN